MKRVRLGIIGSGGMASHRAERFGEIPEFQVVALLARNPETGPALAGKLGVRLATNLSDLLEGVDAVAICTHNETHGRFACSALDAGKHVFTEYPVSRTFEEGDRLIRLAQTSGCVLRVAHEAAISGSQAALREATATAGSLLAATFVRLTPGRGRRPEILFNLPVSGPPALFFVYHTYPLVDLFGPAAWVEASAEYVGLTPEGRYDRFVNAVTLGFVRGGIGQWTWAGGIEVREAEEYQRIVMTGGTLVRSEGGWSLSTSRAVTRLSPDRDRSLETTFRDDLTASGRPWLEEARKAWEACRIGLAAEQSAREGRRIALQTLPCVG